MNRPCDIAVTCTDLFDPGANFDSIAPAPARSRCRGIACEGDDVFANFSSEFEDDGEFFRDLFHCGCVGESYFDKIFSPGITGPWTWEITGTMPPGIFALDNFPSPGVLTLSGVFADYGRFTFTVAVTDGFGNRFEKQFAYNILQIVNSALPQPVIGVPYSVQMIARGGSGHYAWKITEGALAPGLRMDINGLISGTPVSEPLECVTIHVIDTQCENPDRSYFAPYVEMIGTSQTTIARLLGFDEFTHVPNTPYKRYKQLTWAGSTHHDFVLFHPAPIQPFVNPIVGDATFRLFGSVNVDSEGNVTGAKEGCGFVPCVSNLALQPFGRCTASAPALPIICPCYDPFTPVTGGCVAFQITSGEPKISGMASIRDTTFGLFFDAPYTSLTPTVADTVKSGAFIPSPGGIIVGGWSGAGFYPSPISATGVINFDHNFQTVLSDEYTQAEALANADTFSGRGLVAESIPFGPQFVSRQTAASYELRLKNLQIGTDYIASVTLIDSDLTVTLREYPFTASAMEQSINDTIPTPADNHFILATNARVRFA